MPVALRLPVTVIAAVLLSYSLPIHEGVSAPVPADIREDIYHDRLPPGAVARLGTVRLRSANDVDRAALSPDAKFLVTMRSSCSLEVWDGQTGQLLRTIPMVQYKAEPLFRGDRQVRMIPEEIAAMAFATDSGKFHVLTQNGILRSCNLTTGTWSEPLARTASPPPKDPTRQEGWGRASPDGTHFTFTWDVEQPRLEVFTIGKDKAILDLKDAKLQDREFFSVDNKLITVSSHGTTLKVTWDTAAGKPTSTFTGPDLQFHNATVSPDEKSLAAVYAPKEDVRRRDDPYTLIVWETATGKERYRIPDWRAYLVGYTPDGTKLVCKNSREVIVSDAATGKIIHRLHGHDLHSLRGCAFSADGKHFATCGGRDRSAIIWDLSTGKPALDIDAPRGPTSTIVFSPDGKTVFTSTTEQHAGYLWDATTGKRKHRLIADGEGYPQAAAFTPNGEYVVAGYGYGASTGTKKKFAARLWRVSDGKLIREFEGHPDGVLTVTLSPDGKQLATRERTGGKVRLWEVDTGKLTKEIGWIDDYEALIAFSERGDLLGMSTNRKGGCEITNLTTGKVLTSWNAEDSTRPHAISPDGRLIASRDNKRPNGEQFVIRLAATGESVCLLPTTHVSHLSPVAFSRDGKSVAAANRSYGFGDEGTVYLFDTATGRELRKIRAHRGPLTALAFAPDGRQLATGSADTTVLIWDLTTNP